MRRVPLLIALVGVAAVSAACYVGTGTYPVDVFYEMHYQQSVKPQEPPRLEPPAGSVPRSTPEASGTGAELFASNCAMCHGAGGKGDGLVLQVMEQKYGYQPVLDPDLTSEQVQGLSRDAMGQILSDGVQVMPGFDRLLTPEERRRVVEYVLGLR